MLFLIGIVLAIFVLPSPWGLVAVGVGARSTSPRPASSLVVEAAASQRSASETLVGQIGVAVGELWPEGQVKVNGEIWSARCAGGLRRGDEGRRRRVESTALTRWSGRRPRLSRREAQAHARVRRDRASAAGRASRTSARSRESSARRSMRSSRVGTAWRSPDVPTRESTRPARWRASTSRAARRRERAAEALNARAARRRRGPRVPRRPRRSSTRASRRARARTATACSPRDHAAPLEAERALWWPRPVDVDALAAAAALLAGRARLPRVHADGDAARGVPAERARGRAGSARAIGSTSRSRPTASFGTWCGRSSGRCSSSGPDAPDRMREPARRPSALARRGSPPRRGASTSSASSTDECAWLRSRDAIAGALSRRPLRPRRHADRLRADHPRVDAARGPHRARARDPAATSSALTIGGPGDRRADAGDRRRSRRRAASRRTRSTTTGCTRRSRRSTSSLALLPGLKAEGRKLGIVTAKRHRTVGLALERFPALASSSTSSSRTRTPTATSRIRTRCSLALEQLGGDARTRRSTSATRRSTSGPRRPRARTRSRWAGEGSTRTSGCSQRSRMRSSARRRSSSVSSRPAASAEAGCRASRG